jgi:Fic/DOC family
MAALLTAARRKLIEPHELLQQRASFARGNANIDGGGFSRATVSIVVRPDTSLDNSSRVTSERRTVLETILHQYDLVVELVKAHTTPDSARFILTPDIIVNLQASLAFSGGPQPGYRSFPVRIVTNEFEPVAPSEVPRAVEELCAYVNQNWDTADALELAAYVLWRLNWIHPFNDGNGRTARALSYIILCIKLGSLLPGTPTIPEQLLERRGDYYDALARADEAYRERGIVDIGSVRDLLSAMLLRQLDMEPALSSEDMNTLQEDVNRRVHAAPVDLISGIFGDGEIQNRLWSLDEYLVLQVGPHPAISEAEARRVTEDSPFPRLLAPRGQNGLLLIGEGEHGLILRRKVLDASAGYALSLEPNAAVTIERPHVVWRGAEGDGSWELMGSLYVIRLGRQLALPRARRMFDILLARHMASLRS